MPMVKKSISVTDRQDGWIKAQIASGHFGNESKVPRPKGGAFRNPSINFI